MAERVLERWSCVASIDIAPSPPRGTMRAAYSGRAANVKECVREARNARRSLRSAPRKPRPGDRGLPAADWGDGKGSPTTGTMETAEPFSTFRAAALRPIDGVAAMFPTKSLDGTGSARRRSRASREARRLSCCSARPKDVALTLQSGWCRVQLQELVLPTGEEAPPVQHTTKFRKVPCLSRM